MFVFYFQVTPEKDQLSLEDRDSVEKEMVKVIKRALHIC